MDRRSFLKGLAATLGLVAVSPKLIFDMGKNSHIYTLRSQLTELDIEQAFLAAPPLIAQAILDFTITHPTWLEDLLPEKKWPLGNGALIWSLK